MARRKIVVVTPAKNEEKTIGNIIRRIYGVNEKYKLGDMKVLVVSDSLDNTEQVAKKAGAIVIRGDGKGLGSAMFLGIKKAAQMKPDIIVSIDCDGQTNPEEIKDIIKPIINDEADLVSGSRFYEKGLIKYKMSLVNRIGNKSLSWMVRRITKLPITDAQAGFRAMKREVAESLEMIGTHTYVQETLIDAAKKSFRIKEIPSVWNQRPHGNSKVVSSAKRYFIWTLPTLILRAGIHMSFFVILGIIFSLLGFLLGLSILVSESFNFTRIFAHLPSLLLTTLLISVGIQMFFFGFLLNMVADLKGKIDKIKQF